MDACIEEALSQQRSDRCEGRAASYYEAGLCDRTAITVDNTYKLGRSASKVSTQVVEKMVVERVEVNVAKLMEATTRKKDELPSLEEDVTSPLSANIHAVVLPPKF